MPHMVTALTVAELRKFLKRYPGEMLVMFSNPVDRKYNWGIKGGSVKRINRRSGRVSKRAVTDVLALR